MPVLTPTQALTLTALSAHAARGLVNGTPDPERAFTDYITALSIDSPETESRRALCESVVRKMTDSAGMNFDTELKNFQETLDAAD